MQENREKKAEEEGQLEEGSHHPESQGKDISLYYE